MNLGRFNLGGLAAAAFAGAFAVFTGILNSGHSDPKSLGAGALLGAGAGLLAGLLPPHKADGTLSPVYQYGQVIAGHLPGQAGQIAQDVLGVAASLPTATGTGTVTESTTSSATVSPSAAAVAAPPGLPPAVADAPAPTPSNGATATPAPSPSPAQNAALESLLAQAAALGIAHLLPGAAAAKA